MICRDKNSLLVNLYGGPGTGKSTTAALLFGKLKQLGVDCELVREVAKDYVWEDRSVEFQNQLCLLGKQLKKINSVIGKVDVVILDSPIYLNAYYNQNYEKNLFNTLCSKTYEFYDNVDIFLNRVKEYNPNGRFQTEEQSNKVAEEILELLDQCIPGKYHKLDADVDVVRKIIKILVNIKPSLFIDLNNCESVFDAVLDIDEIMKRL